MGVFYFSNSLWPLKYSISKSLYFFFLVAYTDFYIALVSCIRLIELRFYITLDRK